MQLWQAVLLGVVQGFTEFIPVSSSGHLILVEQWLGGVGTQAFDLALHLGTLLALLVYFRRDWLGLITGSQPPRLGWYIGLATLPAIVAGVALSGLAEDTFRSAQLVAVNLIWVGILMLVIDRKARQRELADIQPRDSLSIGAAQALALIPGVSRSGITITAGLGLGLSRTAATRFSFLISAPIIAVAVAKVLLEGESLRQMAAEPLLFIVGGAAAAVSGYAAIRFMINFLSRIGLAPFAYYRLALGAFLLAITWL